MAGQSVDVPGVGAAAFGRYTGSMGIVEFYQPRPWYPSRSLSGASTPSTDKTIVLAKAAAGRV